MTRPLPAAALAIAAAAWPALGWAAPQIGLHEGPDLNLVRLGAAFLLCCGIAMAAALLMKRFGPRGAAGVRFAGWPRRSSSGLTIVEARRVSVHADVCRLAYDGREYLVVVSAGSTTLLAEKALVDAAASIVP